MLALLGCGSGPVSKSRYDAIPSSDRACHQELEKARTDIVNGHLVYCHHAGNLLYFRLRSAKELEELLRTHGIGYKEAMTSDVVIEGQTQWCYCGLMEEQIAAKYGEHFMDSLIDVSDDWFVKNAISNGDTLYYAECDTRPRYPGDDEHPDDDSDSLQASIERHLHYPSGYQPRPNLDSSAFADVRFVVDTAGNATILYYHFLFDMEMNHLFEDTLIAQIERCVQRTGWSPALVRGRKVKADMNYRVYFD